MTERLDLTAWRAHRSGSSTVDELVQVMAVERVSATSSTALFTGGSTAVPERRVFGGQILAQCAVAATLTVAPPAILHSMHAYFVRAGRPAVKIHFEVAAVRDGRSFAVRRVDALQDNEIIASVIASLHTPEDGITHQDPMPTRPDPETLPARWPFYLNPDGPARAGAVELRACSPEPGAPESSVWLRATAPLPDDPVLHQAMFIYLSDFSILHGAFNRHGVARPEVRTASLDHSIWLHRPGRADDWLLYDSRSPSAAGARASAKPRCTALPGTSSPPPARRCWSVACRRDAALK